MWHRSMVIQGDMRVSNVASKFSNFNGFPVGYLSAMLALYGLVRVLQGHREGWASLSIGAASALILHTTTGIALATLVPIALVACYLVHRPVPARRLLVILGAIALGALVAAPVVAPVVAAFQGPGPSLRHAPGFGATVAWALGPQVVIAALGVLILRRRARLVEWYLLCWGLALALGALLTTFPDDNQYKFVFLAAQPLGLLVAWVVQRWGTGWAAKAAVVSLSGAILLNILACEISYADRARRYELPIESSGTEVNLTAPLEDYGQAYAWVREHTATEALFVEAPQDNALRFFPLVARRALYVSAFDLAYMYRESPEFETRWQAAETLFTLAAPKQDALAQVAAAAPEVYLLLELDSLDGNYIPLKKEFDHMEQLNSVFFNPSVTIYRVRDS